MGVFLIPPHIRFNSENYYIDEAFAKYVFPEKNILPTFMRGEIKEREETK